MRTVRDVLDALERVAPAELALDWDNVGLQIGDPSATVARATVALDASASAVCHALESGSQLLLTHHPLLFSPPKSIHTGRGTGAILASAARGRINVLAAHTNWDHAEDGLNDELARVLELRDVTPFGDGPEIALATLVVYTPTGTEERLIEAMSNAGAGAIGHYRRCAFVSHGWGTFEPIEGANPHIGRVGRRESVEEARIKMVLPLSRKNAVIAAMRAAHPYEEVAHSLLPIIGGLKRPAGRIGALPRPSRREAFLDLLRERLGTTPLAWGGAEVVRRVALVGGAADSEWSAALAAGADAFVTGEVKHHNALAASEAGLLVASAGHYATENPGMAYLARRMAAELPEIAWEHWSPNEGQAGKPW